MLERLRKMRLVLTQVWEEQVFVSISTGNRLVTAMTNDWASQIDLKIVRRDFNHKSLDYHSWIESTSSIVTYLLHYVMTYLLHYVMTYLWYYVMTYDLSTWSNMDMMRLMTQDFSFLIGLSVQNLADTVVQNFYMWTIFAF